MNSIEIASWLTLSKGKKNKTWGCRVMKGNIRHISFRSLQFSFPEFNRSNWFWVMSCAIDSEGMAWKFSWWCILITTRNIFCVRFVDCGHFSAISIQKKLVIVNYVISTLKSRLCLAHLYTKLLRNFYTVFILLKSLIPGKKRDLFAFSKLGYNILPVAIVLYVVGRRPMSYDWFRTLANGKVHVRGFLVPALGRVPCCKLDFSVPDICELFRNILTMSESDCVTQAIG